MSLTEALLRACLEAVLQLLIGYSLLRICVLLRGGIMDSDCPASSTLPIARWGVGHERDDKEQQLCVDLRERPVKMAHSVATGQALVSNGQLGCDLIRLGAGQGFVPHTHPGDHLLIVLGGKGTVTLGGTIHPTEAGQVYLVPGAVPHAVGAITEHVILAVGSPHKAVDDESRMQPVAYQAVLAQTECLHCLICQQAASFPALLHDLGCPHCPCGVCVHEPAV
jgi:quercetin dioxygenase-like cupin family protein